MTETMPPTRVQLQKMHRALAEKVLDKACNDPDWKRQFIEDPQLAMRQANFPEAQQLQQAASQHSSEVQGQYWSGGSSWQGGGNWQGGSWQGRRWDDDWYWYRWWG